MMVHLVKSYESRMALHLIYDFIGRINDGGTVSSNGDNILSGAGCWGRNKYYFELCDLLFFIKNINKPSECFNIKDYITFSNCGTMYRSSAHDTLRHSKTTTPSLIYTFQTLNTSNWLSVNCCHALNTNRITSFLTLHIFCILICLCCKSVNQSIKC